MIMQLAFLNQFMIYVVQKPVKEDGVGSSSGNEVSDIWINNVAHDSLVKDNTQN